MTALILMILIEYHTRPPEGAVHIAFPKFHIPLHNHVRRHVLKVLGADESYNTKPNVSSLEGSLGG